MLMDRLALLRERMAELNCDLFLTNQPENRRYLSGFTCSNGWLFITPSDCKVATDFRYFEQVKMQAPDFGLIEMKGRWEELLPEVLQGLGAKRLAFESDYITHDQYQMLARVLPAGMELVPTNGCGARTARRQGRLRNRSDQESRGRYRPGHPSRPLHPGPRHDGARSGMATGTAHAGGRRRRASL